MKINLTGDDGFKFSLLSGNLLLCLCVCETVCVLSGTSREAAHILCEPGVELRLNQIPGLVQISRLCSPSLRSLSLDLALHLSPAPSTQS